MAGARSHQISTDEVNKTAELIRPSLKGLSREATEDNDDDKWRDGQMTQQTKKITSVGWDNVEKTLGWKRVKARERMEKWCRARRQAT